jgi:phage gpG-like protein
VIELTIDGAEALGQRLRGIATRLEGSPRVLFESAGELMKTFFRDHIESGGEGLGWPELKPATRAIRKHYGHDGKKTLVRGGDLLQSIDVRSVDEFGVTVGTDLTGGPTGDVPVARILQDGGEVTDDHGRRTVQAFPFIVLSDTELTDLGDLITNFYADLIADA